MQAISDAAIAVMGKRMDFIAAFIMAHWTPCARRKFISRSIGPLWFGPGRFRVLTNRLATNRL